MSTDWVMYRYQSILKICMGSVYNYQSVFKMFSSKVKSKAENNLKKKAKFIITKSLIK